MQMLILKRETGTPVAVSGGELLMDFNKNAFQTSLDLYHMQLGSANFEADGRIYGGGYFIQETTSRVLWSSQSRWP